MVDERVLAREALAAGAQGKTVLEVGAGFGFLTRKLAEAGAKRVIALEKDARMVPILECELAPFENVEVVHADFLKWKPARFDVFASNVPYSISSPVLFRLAEMDFERAVICLQREFVERMVAKPGTKGYSRLSVASQARFRMRILERVPRTAFSPPPKVDSTIIELVPKGERISKGFERLIMLLFQHKKKTLRAALSDSAEGLGISKAEARLIAEKSGLSGRRVFTLAKGEFEGLALLF